MSPALPQPIIDLTNNVLTASLPSHDSVTINLYGATVTSWKLSNGSEQIFLSDSAHLDGSKPIRGGIPLVFPVFGPPPKEGHATSKLPQHGFARNNYWEFLGSSRSENMAGKRGTGSSVKLDFGLGSASLSEETKSKWPYDFGLVYSVELGSGRLETSMHVTNTGKESFDFQCLFHTYFRIKDISKTSISGLKSSPYVDKVLQAQTFTEESSSVSLTSETDRVYTPPDNSDGTPVPLTILENGKPKLTITRDSLPDITVWNLWDEKAKGMADFSPKDGWKQMLAVEPGAVSNWIKLEAGDAWEGGQIIEAHE